MIERMDEMKRLGWILSLHSDEIMTAQNFSNLRHSSNGNN